MSSAVVVERRADGTLTSAGARVVNPTGVNQHSPRVILQRRIDLAVVRELDERPECVTTFAEQVADALADPKNNLEFLRVVLDRVWAAVHRHELQLDGELPPSSSAEQWDAIAERAGEQVIDVEAVAIAEPDSGAVEGAD